MPSQSAPQFELAFPATEMRAFSRLDADGKERHYIRGTASSTLKDLKGSVISAKAQVQMLEKLRDLASRMASENSGMTAWLSHNYLIPEDCLGAFTDASLTTRDEGDESYIDLDIECRLVDFASNPRAEAAYKQIKDGIRHGWSIGAYFTDIEWLSDDPKSDDFYVYKVNALDLLEISLVGIPANQRAWVRDAASAKEYAVKRAEMIATDSRSSLDRRQLVTRSIIEHRTPLETERLAMAQDFRERSQQTFLSEESRQTLARAADVLEARDDGGALSPDDMRDRIGLGMSHLAKAVGHGLCVKSATHVAKAIDCLGTMMGAGVSDPSDPANQNNMNADIPEDRLAELRQEWEREQESVVAEQRSTLESIKAEIAQKKSELDAVAANLTADSSDSEKLLAIIDADVAAKKGELESLAAQASALQETLAATTADRDRIAAELDAKRAELEALAADIEKRKQERVGRLAPRSTNELLAARNETEITPEHYNQTYAQRQDALKRQLRGDAAQLSGRDMAAGLQ